MASSLALTRLSYRVQLLLPTPDPVSGPAGGGGNLHPAPRAGGGPATAGEPVKHHLPRVRPTEAKKLAHVDWVQRFATRFRPGQTSSSDRDPPPHLGRSTHPGVTGRLRRVGFRDDSHDECPGRNLTSSGSWVVHDSESDQEEGKERQEIGRDPGFSGVNSEGFSTDSFHASPGGLTFPRCASGVRRVARVGS